MTTTTLTRAPLSRTIRKVDVVLGLMTFAAALHGVVADQNDDLSGVCNQGHDPIKIQQVDKCPSCGNTDKSTFVRGQVKGSEIILPDADKLAEIRTRDDTFKGNVVVRPVEADDQLMVPSGPSYFLAPATATAGNAYAVLAAVIRKRPKVAFLTELSMAGAPKLFRLTVDGDNIVLREIARPEALRERPAVTGTVQAGTLKLAEQLVDSELRPFDPAQFRNQHHADVQALLEQSRPALAGAPAGAVGGDVMAQLQASIAASGAPVKAPVARRRRASSEDATTATTATTAATVTPVTPVTPVTRQRKTKKVA